MIALGFGVSKDSGERDVKRLTHCFWKRARRVWAFGHHVQHNSNGNRIVVDIHVIIFLIIYASVEKEF